ncbi:MAG: hypothetical protein PUE55_00840 [Bacteroidales bacterium]|nr:hypothetical protein [Bacteroidales bacterium]
MKKKNFLFAALTLAALSAGLVSCESDNLKDSSKNHEWVDLGLSVKWATCNMGATKPEEYGDYYAWGETEPKDYYDWSTYKWCNDDYGTLTKYCTSSEYGTVDNKTTLDPEDDAARANWGGSWRMPTDGEWAELLDECIWEWKNAYKGTTAGYLVTSKINGNSIFLPAAGCRNDGDLEVAGYCGYYWSSSLQDRPDGGGGASFYSDGAYYGGGGSRCFGLSVRPVCK